MSKNQALTKNDRNRAFGQLLKSKLPKIERALPDTVKRYLTAERVANVALMGISENPLLASCTEVSIVKSVINLASVGLEPGGPLGQAYLVPFKNNKLNPPAYEAQAIIGYRGYISLARRSGDVASIVAQVVYEKDEFDFDFASETPIKHKPYLKGDRGKALGVYCLARFKDGSTHPEFMPMAEVEKIRRRSRAGDNGPWKTDYEEMAKKTVVRRASKYWPLTVEFAEAMHIDNQADAPEIESPIIEANFQVEPEELQSANEKAYLMIQGDKKEDEWKDDKTKK